MEYIFQVLSCLILLLTISKAKYGSNMENRIYEHHAKNSYLPRHSENHNSNYVRSGAAFFDPIARASSNFSIFNGN